MMKREIFFKIAICALLVAGFVRLSSAQTTAFTYQGRLNDAAVTANGTYDFQFALFDAAANGNQIGTTVQRPAVSVSGGVFTVQLDFGAVSFPGADRFLEISVKRPADTVYTTLAPRQSVTSTPYTIRSLSSSTADTATNAQQLGGTPANQFVQTGDPRLSDSRQPLAGSSNYIQNTTAQQANANFNVSGNGTIGGGLSVTGNLTTGGALTIGSVASSGGTTPLCVNGTNLVAGCSRYSTTLTITGSSQLNLAHGLNTLDVMVTIYKSNGDGTWIIVPIDNSTASITLLNANNARLVLIPAGTFRVLIWR